MNRTKRCYVVAGLLVAAWMGLVSSTLAQPAGHCRGIEVGDIGLYDEGVLYSMMSSLAASLAQAKSFDYTTVAQQIGKIQSIDATLSQLQATVNYSPLTGTTTAPTGNGTATTAAASGGGGGGGNGSSSGDNGSSSTTPATPSTTPPAVPAGTTLPLPGSTAFGAQDTLAEQMQMSYQLMNLQSLLQQSLSDRFVLSSGQARQKVLVGIPIYLDPPYKGAIAEVKVTIWVTKSAAGDHASDPPRLIALMPQESTYNRAVYVNEAHAFSLGGIVQQVVGVGLQASGAHNQTYLVRDADTIAMIYPPERNDSRASYTMTFGWQFKPVLGEPTVRPGRRDLFAVIGMPNDASGLLQSATERDPAPCQLHFSIQSCWRKSKSGGRLGRVEERPEDDYGDERHEDRRFSVEEPPTPGEYCGCVHFTRRVPAVGLQDKPPVDLWSPWQLAGKTEPLADNVRVKRCGANLFQVLWVGQGVGPQTQLLIGDTVMSAGAGLTCIGDTRLQAIMPLSKLAVADPIFVTPGSRPTWAVDEAARDAYWIPYADVPPNPEPQTATVELLPGETQATVRATLTNCQGQDAKTHRTAWCLPYWSAIGTTPWFAVIGGQAVDLPDETFAPEVDTAGNLTGRCTVTFTCDASLLAGADYFYLRQGLMGLRNAFKVPIEESTLFAVSTVQLLARIPGDKPENDQYRLAISGKHLNGNIHMRVGSGAEATLEAPYVGLPRSNILVFDVAAKNLDPVVQASGDAGATALVWGQKMKPDGRTPDGPVYCQTVVAIPKDAKAALATPNTPDISLDPSSPAVYKGQTPVVIASGPKVKFVQVLNGVLFGTTPLHYKWADPDKDKLLVILNKDSTKDAGRQTLEFLLTTGDSQYVPLQVLDSPSAADQGGSSQKSQ